MGSLSVANPNESRKGSSETKHIYIERELYRVNKTYARI